MMGLKTSLGVVANHHDPLGMTADGRVIWPIVGADSDGEDSEQEDSDDDDDTDDDDDADDQDDDGKKGKKSKKDKEPEDDDDDDAAFWHSRADRFKARMEAADRRATVAERENRRLKAGKDDSLDEHGKQDLKDSVARAAKAESDLAGLRLQNAILTDTTYQWEDPELVLAALAKDDTVEIDENGKVVGVKQALKALAKSKPFLVKKAVIKPDPKDADDEDDDDDEDDEEPAKKRTSGAPSNGRKSKSTTPDRKALIAKYPSLSRR
jgi:hypothetical protein